jgi:hypothetical protein
MDETHRCTTAIISSNLLLENIGFSNFIDLWPAKWLPNADQVSCSACQIGPSVSYWFRCWRVPGFPSLHADAPGCSLRAAGGGGRQVRRRPHRLRVQHRRVHVRSQGARHASPGRRFRGLPKVKGAGTLAVAGAGCFLSPNAWGNHGEGGVEGAHEEIEGTNLFVGIFVCCRPATWLFWGRGEGCWRFSADQEMVVRRAPNSGN